MKKVLPLCLSAAIALSACTGGSSTSKKTENMITKHPAAVSQVVDSLAARYAGLDVERATRAVQQVASLWLPDDGSVAELVDFCVTHYVADEVARERLFVALSDKLELLLGSFHQIDVGLKAPLHEIRGELQAIDYTLGAYDVTAHFKDDMFATKVAFVTVLNFPSYTLREKQERGGAWTPLEWGYARLGDLFTSRIPADVQQQVAAALTASDNYIMDYNIMMGELRNEANEALFPKGMSLISHWNLRDELKSNYADAQRGLEKQRMIYTVMKRIVTQEIPAAVINNDKVQWNPLANKVYDNGLEVAAEAEPDTRYVMLLNNFKALQQEDVYTPLQPTYIERAFEGGMEFSEAEVKEMFTTFISSPEVRRVAALIEKRLGRSLEPFDIWYDGFKSRSHISEDALTALTQRRYPDALAFERDMPEILRRLGFPIAEAQRISDKIQVDPARGSGHAWGAVMKGDKARLRTRIPQGGMDYKGYNIAMHEFGHNVEQTISLYDVDYYTMNGVPNTAFTEALAFIFQKRDLDILEVKGTNAQAFKASNTVASASLESLNPSAVLDIFWGCYEIMGVALLDMAVWEWMYAHPNATPAELKENVLRLARELWNRYYAPVLGEPDSPVLAIYSHMINNQLYLANYPMGHLIEFQLEGHLRGKNLANEVLRIYKMGRLTPQLWMQRATGNALSIEPMLNAAAKAVENGEW